METMSDQASWKRKCVLACVFHFSVFLSVATSVAGRLATCVILDHRLGEFLASLQGLREGLPFLYINRGLSLTSSPAIHGSLALNSVAGL